MPRYKVAHVREQGIDLIIVPLERSFETRSQLEQQQTINTLEMRAHAAGLAGTVVPVWEYAGGRMRFIAPQNWHAFFKSLSLQAVFGAINKELYW